MNVPNESGPPNTDPIPAESSNPALRELNVQLMAMTYFYGFLLFLFAQVPVFAAGGFAALGVSAMRGGDFENYLYWTLPAFECAAIYVVSGILKKSFASLERRRANDWEELRKRGLKFIFIKERMLAILLVATGMGASAWIQFLDAYSPANQDDRPPGLIVWAVVTAFGSVFMACYMAARAWLYRDVRLDSIAGLATMLFGLWLAVRR
jgi:hypothetical protein